LTVANLNLGDYPHMPARILTHLGMWREVLAANERATAEAAIRRGDRKSADRRGGGRQTMVSATAGFGYTRSRRGVSHPG
jgi:hypothetical protein